MMKILYVTYKKKKKLHVKSNAFFVDPNGYYALFTTIYNGEFKQASFVLLH